MEAIEREFNRRFRKQGIELPKDKIERREGGVLGDRNNSIFYAFGKDDKGEHINVYTEHRFAWGHYHFRIYENGEVLNLPVDWDLLFTSSKATKEENEKREEEWRNHNRMVYGLLEKEGIQAVMEERCEEFSESPKESSDKPGND